MPTMAKNETSEEVTEETEEVEETESVDEATVKGWVKEALEDFLPRLGGKVEDVEEEAEHTSSLTLKDIEEATRRAVAEAMKPLRATAKKAVPAKKTAPKKEPEDTPTEPGRRSWAERMWGAE